MLLDIAFVGHDQLAVDDDGGVVLDQRGRGMDGHLGPRVHCHVATVRVDLGRVQEQPVAQSFPANSTR